MNQSPQMPEECITPEELSRLVREQTYRIAELSRKIDTLTESLEPHAPPIEKPDHQPTLGF
jgi:hypothetical protein